jgi:hypothetical protein
VSLIKICPACRFVNISQTKEGDPEVSWWLVRLNLFPLDLIYDLANSRTTVSCPSCEYGEMIHLKSFQKSSGYQTLPKEEQDRITKLIEHERKQSFSTIILFLLVLAGMLSLYTFIFFGK